MQGRIDIPTDALCSTGKEQSAVTRESGMLPNCLFRP